MQFLPTFLLNAEPETGAQGSFGKSQVRATTPFAHLLGKATDSSEKALAGSLMDAKAAAFLAEAGDAAGASRRLAARASSKGKLASQAGSGTTASSSTENASAGGKLRSLLAGVGGKTQSKGNSLQNLVVTREDFAALREGLAQYGFTATELDDLQALVNSKGGLTWGRLVSVAARKMAGLDAFPQELSADESRLIQNFFSKLGCTPQESEDLLNKLSSGETAGVWQVLQEKLAALPEGSILSLDRDELAALSKALRLKSEQEKRLAAYAGENGSLNLPVQDLKAVLAELKTEAAKTSEERTSQASALRDLVAKVFEAARDKAGVAATADNRLDGDGKRARLLAEAAKDERQAEKDEYRPLSGKHAEGEDQAAASRIPGESRSRAAEDARKHSSTDGRDQGAADGRQQGKEAQAAEKAASQTKTASQTEDQKAWNEFWSKVAKDRASATEARAEAKRATTETTLNPDAAAAQRTESPQATTTAGVEKFAPRDVLRQVEGGMLRNLGEGTKQLTLRLDPPELGKLNLQLTVRGDEVKVVFKAENADAGHMLQENLGQLRQALESQGLKVSKMEVQTQLSDGGLSQGWNGADRHNEARDREETARNLDRMRILRGNDVVVQEMQPGDLTAIHSHTGLSVIA